MICMICTRCMSDWHGNAFTLSLIGYIYTSTREIAVRHSHWLYRLFSHVKIKRTDLYKWALWNKILVLCVINKSIRFLSLFLVTVTTVKQAWVVHGSQLLGHQPAFSKTHQPRPLISLTLTILFLTQKLKMCVLAGI